MANSSGLLMKADFTYEMYIVERFANRRVIEDIETRYFMVWGINTELTYIFPISSNGSFKSPSHIHDSTYHGLCCTSRGALAGTRNRSMGPSKGKCSI